MSEDDRDAESDASEAESESESSVPSSHCLLELPCDAFGACADSAGLLDLLAEEAAAAE